MRSPVNLAERRSPAPLLASEGLRTGKRAATRGMGLDGKSGLSLVRRWGVSGFDAGSEPNLRCTQRGRHRANDGAERGTPTPD